MRITGGLYYFKWNFDQAQIYEDLLTNEQLGELFRAVMDYARDGTETEVSAVVAFPYRECKLAVDRSHTAYEKKCETNRANGAKGGKAKAERMKQAQGKEDQVPQYKPPTKPEFKAIVSHLKKNEEIDPDTDDYDALKFYDSLVADNWCIGGEAIRCNDELETAMLCKFACEEDIPFNRFLFWKSFVLLFGKYHGCRDAGGQSKASFINDHFWELYDSDNEGWTFNGQFFGIRKMAVALDAYMTNDKTTEP